MTEYDLRKSTEPALPPATGSMKHLSSAKKRWLVGAKVALFALVLFFVGRALAHRVAAVSWSTIQFKYGAFLFAVLVQTASMSMGPIVYRLLLQPLGCSPSWAAVFSIAWIARAGKYLPGKVAPAVGTVLMLRREGVPVVAATSVTLLYQVLTLIIVMLTAIPLTLWPPVRDALPASGLWFFLLIPVCFASLHPKVLFPAANFLLGRLGMPTLNASHRMRDYIFPLVVMGIGQLMAGVTLWLILQSVAPVPVRWLPVCIGGIAVAGGAGMLAPFAPAGLGVREGILLVILDRIVDPSHAAVAVLLSRLLQTLVEVVMAAVGAAMLQFRKRATEPSEA